MIRRLVALVALLFYGSLDRVTSLMPDPDYPDDHDPLASSCAGVDVPTVEERGLATRLLAS